MGMHPSLPRGLQSSGRRRIANLPRAREGNEVLRFQVDLSAPLGQTFERPWGGFEKIVLDFRVKAI